MSILATVTGLFVGKSKNRWPGKPPSAIGKHPVDGPLKLEPDGFEHDQQADLTAHGGEDKALHHYAGEHYSFWNLKFPQLSKPYKPGDFGENISTAGITEHDLCIADVLKLGTALVQVSQGRRPCWKLNAHTDNEKMAYWFQKTGHTGWYYRILEPGEVRVGDELVLVQRSNETWPLNKLIAARFNPALSLQDATELAQMPQLAQTWRDAFEKKKDRHYNENTTPRLSG